MNLILVFFFLSLTAAIAGWIVLRRDSDSIFGLLGGLFGSMAVVFLGLCSCTISSTHLVTPVTATITKTPNAVIVEATVDNAIIREVLTNVSDYRLAGQPNTRVVLRQGVNAWGVTLDASRHLVIEEIAATPAK